jgi:hypothetical protein
LKPVAIYDYVDGRVTMLARMFENRPRAYRAMGYQVDEMGDDDGDEEDGEE